MSNRVSPQVIESIVGTKGHDTVHIGRAVSTDEIVYVLHSRECMDSGIDLRNCPFSYAMDEGIDMGVWVGYEDRPVKLRIRNGLLIPSAPVPPTVTIAYRTGQFVECPVKYLGWLIPPHGKALHCHCWRVLNEGPYDHRQGDQTIIEGGSLPQYVETPSKLPIMPS